MSLVLLSLQAARRRQSPRTHLIHHCYEDPQAADTIPLYENFCYALSLFRSRIAENVLEARALLTHLFSFQCGEHFPIYLHEYPHCRDHHLGRKIYPILFWIFSEFSSVLGEELRVRIESLLSELSAPVLDFVPRTAEEWAEFCLIAQLENRLPEEALAVWHPEIGVFLGDNRYEKEEPAVTLLDYYMGELYGKLSARALADNPVQIRAALVRPFEKKGVRPLFSLPQASGDAFFWGDLSHAHSLQIVKREGEEFETLLFCDAHASTEITVGGRRATTFHLGDQILLQSRGVKAQIRFIQESGEGVYFGHIFRANRPGQLKGSDKYETYHWQIGLRTVRPSPDAEIKLELEWL